MPKQTIKEYWDSKLKTNNDLFLKRSSAWDIYNSEIGGKRSTVLKDVNELFSKNPKMTEIWAKIGAHGRSQHSKSEVLLFDTSNMTDADKDNANITYKGNFFERS